MAEITVPAKVDYSMTPGHKIMTEVYYLLRVVHRKLDSADAFLQYIIETKKLPAETARDFKPLLNRIWTHGVEAYEAGLQFYQINEPAEALEKLRPAMKEITMLLSYALKISQGHLSLEEFKKRLT